MSGRHPPAKASRDSLLPFAASKLRHLRSCLVPTRPGLRPRPPVAVQMTQRPAVPRVEPDGSKAVRGSYGPRCDVRSRAVGDVRSTDEERRKLRAARAIGTYRLHRRRLTDTACCTSNNARNWSTSWSHNRRSPCRCSPRNRNGTAGLRSARPRSREQHWERRTVGRCSFRSVRDRGRCRFRSRRLERGCSPDNLANSPRWRRAHCCRRSPSFGKACMEYRCRLRIRFAVRSWIRTCRYRASDGKDISDLASSRGRR